MATNTELLEAAIMALGGAADGMVDRLKTTLLRQAIIAQGGTCDDLPDNLESTLLTRFIETCGSGGGDADTGKTYTVYFCNGNTIAQTVQNVPYGGSATYTGSTPTYNGEGDPADYEFTGWLPNGQDITGDTICFAQFRYTGYVYSKLVEGSISGDYTNQTVEIAGRYAFSSCNNLTSVNFPEVTTLDGYAFSGGKLCRADFSKLQQIRSYAFSNCKAFETLILRNNEVATLQANAFVGCNSFPNGYIYIPAALVDSYKVASMWSTYADKFRALEEYTVDGTTSGALDESKI